MQLLDGKLVSKHIKAGLQSEVEQMKAAGKRAPHLAAILVGQDPASEAYVNSKVRTCAELGYTSTLIRHAQEISEQELLSVIHQFNADTSIDGILVQLPLPPQINEQKIIEAIQPDKDVDGFHPVNQGRLLSGIPGFLPATPYGIMLMLEHYGIQTAGMHAVVIGRSNIVGKPMSILLARPGTTGDCTVTLCHSRTQDLPSFCRQADIVVAAIGRPGFVQADWIKPGAIVIDVGINRVEDKLHPKGYKLTGDVDFEQAASRCSYITPVPGGVGLMTICALMKNTLTAAKRHQV